MSRDNPEFQNVERAPQELVKLIARLGTAGYGRKLTDEQRHVAEAIVTHASNACEVIMDGINVIGRAMACAAYNPDWQLSGDDFNRIGMLISHLVVEAQTLHETAADMKLDLQHEVNQRSKLVAGARK